MPAHDAPRVGDPAPDFALEVDPVDGRAFPLSRLRGRADVVLFFYPKDDTPGCTAQACPFHAEFRRLGAEVVGISGDSGESHARFAGRHRLPYRLVADAGGAIRRSYGIRPTWGFIPGRASVLVDRDGVIRAIHESQFRPASHVPAMLAALAEVQAGRVGIARPESAGGVGAME